MWHRTIRAFTLIELLVVIAITALLARILLPVFSQAREKARAARCSSNLRQLCMAIHQYMQDWEGGLPEFWEWGRTPERYVSLRWYSHLTPYLRNEEVLSCPADSVTNGRRALPWRSPYRDWANYPIIPRLSYGYNYWLQQNRESLVRLPAQTVLVGDCAGLQCADAIPHSGREGDLLLRLRERHSGGG
jgi:prepilin-type N-terminal cleavage/methylation domain-containing protein